MKLRAAVQAEKWDEADGIVDEMAKAHPENNISPQMMKMNILFMRKKYDEAYKIAAALSDAHPDDAALQNAMAWTLAAQPGLEKRDTVLAEKMAERANKASGGKDPSVLDTLARAQFMNGKKDQAIATEKMAVAAADADQGEPLKANLKSYQDGILPEP
jgi:predicted Zn-dependent protease